MKIQTVGRLSNSLILVLLAASLSLGWVKIRHANKKQVDPVSHRTQSDERSIDLSKSVVKWRGTKLMGTGSHEGIVRFKAGKLVFSENQLTGGEFIVDMKSIYITDIPLSDPVPRKNLTTHLNSDFDTGHFPVSSFIITRVRHVDGSIDVSGELKIMSISKTITIRATANQDQTEFKSEFVFNRFDWKIGENGSWLEKRLVDAEVKLWVEIYL